MEYKILYSRESYDLGVRIEVGATNLPDLESDEAELIRHAAYNAVESISQEIEALIVANNPQSKENALKQKYDLIGLFPARIFVEEIPNGYCNRACCRHLPWFVVTTSIGRFKIGWRKRVIQLEWTETVNKKTAEELFPESTNTKENKMIHAWSLAEAQSFISKIFENIT